MNSLKSEVSGQIQSTPVLVYSKSYCPYCDEAKQILQRGGVEAVVHELDQIANGSDIQNALKTLTGQNTVPNIFIGGNHVGGCSDLKAKLKNGQV